MKHLKPKRKQRNVLVLFSIAKNEITFFTQESENITLMIFNLFLVCIVVFSFACYRVARKRIALECAYDSQLGQVLPKIMKKENGELRKRLLERTWWQRYVRTTKFQSWFGFGFVMVRIATSALGR